MPFDGNGNWTSNFSAVADRNANIKIEASRFDNILLADIAQSFETCLTKDMQVKPQQNFDANNFRLINVADPATGSDAVNLSTLNTKDGTAVHKTGTETITGAKTFSGNITSSGTNTWNGSNTFSGSVSLGALATATSPAASDSSTTVATTAWANNTSNNLVHKSGTEIISGQKTLTNDTYIKNTGLATNGTTPDSQKVKQIIFTANDDSVTADIRSRQTTDGRYALDLICSRLVGGTLTNSAISAFVASDGSTYITAPTPSGVTLNNTMVPTTEWIQSWASTSGGLSTFTKSSKGGFKLKNGLVVNWGRATAETNTFAIPFYSNTSYSISTATVANEQSATAWGQVNTLTTTGFKVVGASSSRTICWVAIGF